MRPFEPRSKPDDLRRLLENGTWVRRLVSRLLWDEGLVDDVLQEVWITALERPPSKPGALRAWLGTVARSLCLRANRALRRRRRIERNTAREVQAPSAQEVEERVESQRRLLDAVLSLGEPYRSVVYLHFYEGLKLVEVARLQGTSDSTVRTQLSRGLDQLRERLARDFGGRGTMRAMLLALVLPAEVFLPGRPAAAASVRPAAMSSRVATRSPFLARARRLAPAFVAMVFVATVVLVWNASHGNPTAVRSVAVTGGAAAGSGHVRTTGVRGDAGIHEPGPQATGAIGATVSTRPPAVDSVRVLVVDGPGGRPVHGARVYRAPRTDPRSELLGETAADGTLLVSDPGALRDPWLVLASGFLEHREPAARRDAQGGVHVVELEAELTAVVLVLDPGGSPAPGVPVTILATVRGVHDVEPVTVVTDLEGEAAYTFRHLDTTIRVAAPGHVSLSLPAETPRMTVRIRAGRAADGIVLGPGGVPVPDCRVRIESGSLRNPVSVASDALGILHLGVLDPAEEVTLRFHAPGLPAHRITGRPPADAPWRFQLPGGVTLSGTVSGPDGEPVSGGHVFILGPEGGEDSGAVDGGAEGPVSRVRQAGLPPSTRPTRRLVTRARASIDEAGRFTLGSLPPGGADEYLFVHHPEHGRHLERLEALEPGAPLDVQLARGAKVKGILTSPDKKPLGGVLLHFGEVWSNGIECVIGRTRTDAGGAFAFRGLPEGAGQPLPGAWGEDGNPVVRASVFVAAFAPDVLVERVGPAGSAGPVEEEIFPGCFEISGAISTGEPIRLAGAARERLASLGICLRDGDGVPVRAWTRAVVLDPYGGVHTGVLGRNLHGARYFSDQTLPVERLRGSDLVLLPEGHRSCAISNLDLRESGVLDVTLAPASTSPWRLRLRRADGTPAAGWPVLVGLPFGSASPRAAAALGTTDADGAISVASLPRGAHNFAVPFDREDARGEVMRPEELAERVAWMWAQVLDGSYEDLTAPETKSASPLTP